MVLLTLIKQLWRAMLARLQGLLGATSSTTLVFTGILGLALAYILYRLRGGSGRKPDESASQRPQQQQPQEQQQDPSRPSTSAAAAAGAGQPATANPAPSAAVARRLAGVRVVSMSVPGVLIEETSPEQLDDCATVRAEALGIARQIQAHTRGGLYLMAHVDDDLGEAVVRGALEHAGLLGGEPDQVPPHRLLFCSLLDSKCSFVRQLESDVHIDAHPKTVSDLQRFVKQLVLVQPAGGEGPAEGSLAAANVQHAPSLAAAMGMPSA